jgi:hypothetical protein
MTSHLAFCREQLLVLLPPLVHRDEDTRKMCDCMFTIDSTQVAAFLQVNFDKRITTISVNGAGMFSQALSFTVEQQRE